MFSFNIKELVRLDWIKAPLEATNRDDAIAELCGLLKGQLGLPSSQALANTVLMREKTGAPTSLFREGIAFPHANSAILGRVSIAIGKCKSPMVWGIDGDKVHYVFLVVGPEGELIGQTVVRLNEHFNNPRARKRLKQCMNAQDIYNFLTQIGLDLDKPQGFHFKKIIEPGPFQVITLAWAPDDRLAYSTGGPEHSINIISSDHNAYTTLTGHNSDVISLAWSPDGSRLASGSNDNTIRIWGGHDLSLERVIPTQIQIHGMAWSPDGKILAAAGHLHHVRRWIVDTGEELSKRLGGWMEPALCVAWSHDGSKIAAAGGRSSEGFIVWDAISGNIIKKHEIHDGPLFSIAWSFNDKFLAVGLGNGIVQIWETDNWKTPISIRAHDEDITCLSFSATEDFLATKSTDGSVRIWKAGNWDMVADLPDPITAAYMVAPVAFHPRVLKIATLGGFGNCIRIWSISPENLVPAPKIIPPFATLRIPAALIDEIREHRAILFAGSGISAKVLGIGSSDLKSIIGGQIKRDYPTYDINSRSFEEVMDEYSDLYDLPSLLAKLARLIPQNISDSSVHLAAVRLFNCIITTNWDLLFEDACTKVNKNRQVISTESSIDSFSHSQQNLQDCSILKIHGSISEPTSIVATNYQYDTYHMTHSKTLTLIAELMASHTFLFAGYGLGDSHIRRILETMRLKKGPFARKAYIVGLFDEVRLAALRRHHGFEVIECDGESFFSELETSFP